jgi:hypothetical protein
MYLVLKWVIILFVWLHSSNVIDYNVGVNLYTYCFGEKFDYSVS